METQLLEVFRTVAHLGSITAAARRLRFTQSAVSRQIAALEAEVGARLLDRLPRGIALTEPGRALLPHAEAVLDRLAAARQAVGDLDRLAAGRVRVGAFATAVAALVPRAVTSFRAAFPAVEVSLVEGFSPALLERLAAGDADVAVVSTAPAGLPDPGRFDLHHLLDEPMLVAVSREHRLAGRRTVRLAELADESFVASSPRAAETLLGGSAAAGFQPRIDIVVGEWTGKFGCVAAGLGVTLVPALAARMAPADLVLLRLHPQDASARRIYAATLAGRTRLPAVTNFLTHLDAATTLATQPQ
ncbi:DNA-binding transcriptional LysR family regulator [Actinoplanes octamycinicus]|uniref:DNA-binding transcriptional LysR family regulator n=1 Tax=Actinoplanes octamycinicus TaxID=135948 RepID=A0A7W7MB05_9ACTN|nr:LysR substrate-binding domain-containing protein [Actinoplanes octamycinicus]MBB4743614.1 DNA-binding transcriptional LysR family regulator [Actinoplanes octamycinicus]GIE61039.1 LysR family transcriptional regulator [Actinoplanes octamycinicus]